MIILESVPYKTFGQIAGIAGLCVAVFLSIFTLVVGRTRNRSILKTALYLTWSIAVLGILVWAWKPSPEIPGPASPTPVPSAAKKPEEEPLKAVALTTHSAPKPPNCVRVENDRCTSYSFPVTLHGSQHDKEYYTVTGLKPGVQLQAMYSGIVVPDIADDNPQPAAASVMVRLYGPSGKCEPGTNCEASLMWKARTPQQAQQLKWEKRTAMVQTQATESVAVFYLELTVCSYQGSETALCKPRDGASVTVNVF